MVRVYALLLMVGSVAALTMGPTPREDESRATLHPVSGFSLTMKPSASAGLQRTHTHAKPRLCTFQFTHAASNTQRRLRSNQPWNTGSIRFFRQSCTLHHHHHHNHDHNNHPPTHLPPFLDLTRMTNAQAAP